MKLATLGKNLSIATGRTGLVLRKFSPEILLVIGITGGIASTFLACRATLKMDDVLYNHKNKVERVKDGYDQVLSGEIVSPGYTEKDYKKDLTVVYVQTAVDFAKLYGPAVTLGIASIACIVGGHGIMTKRNVALIAAYKAVEEGFAAYRKRVVEEYGAEKDYMYKNGLKAEQVSDVVTDADGKIHKVKSQKLALDTNSLSQYAKFFDETNPEWSKEPGYNYMYLKSQQVYHNQLLQTRGHVFLNEVYDALGIPRTKAGSVVGWVIGEGDNFIDFGIFNDRQEVRDFVNGYEKSIRLDFNVDGVIIDLI